MSLSGPACAALLIAAVGAQGGGRFVFTPAAVPEPASPSLLTAGLGAALRKRRNLAS